MTVLKFSIFQLIVDRSPFGISTFDAIDEKTSDFVKITSTTSAGSSSEVSMVKNITKQVIDNRFVFFYFNWGDKYPYTPTVMGTSIGTSTVEEKANPRSPEEIEMMEQLFVVLDTSGQRIYISNQKQKGMFVNWLKEKICKPVEMKGTFEEISLIDKLSSVDSIGFTLFPNLFSTTSSDTLIRKISEDINGYGAVKAQITFHYKNKSPIDTTKIQAINNLLHRKNELADIVVVGMNEERMETVFNMEEIVNRLVIEIPSMKHTLLEPAVVSQLLIDRILER